MEQMNDKPCFTFLYDVPLLSLVFPSPLPLILSAAIPLADAPQFVVNDIKTSNDRLASSNKQNTTGNEKGYVKFRLVRLTHKKECD